MKVTFTLSRRVVYYIRLHTATSQQDPGRRLHNVCGHEEKGWEKSTVESCCRPILGQMTKRRRIQQVFIKLGFYHIRFDLTWISSVAYSCLYLHLFNNSLCVWIT
jgi:hypothetical protein